MGIRRRSLGGGLLAGLGQGLSQLAESRVKRRQFDQVQALEQQKQRQQALASLGSNIAQNPNSYQLQTQMAGQNPLLRGIDLSGFKPSNEVLLRPLGAQIQSAEDPLKLPGDLSFAAKLLGADIPAYQPPQMAPTDEGPADPVTQLPPALQPYAAQLLQRQQTLAQGQEAALDRAGATKRVEAYGTGVGSGQAAHENAPAALGDKVTEATTLGPINAANAGLTTGAQFDATHTPDRLRADAQGAGMNAAAEAAARIRAEGQRLGLSQEQISNAMQLGTAFRSETTNFRTQEGNFRTILSAVKDPSPAGDLSVIFAFMKMVDPNSSVREGEFATAQNAASVPEQIRNSYNRVTTGKRLGDDGGPTRDDFLKQAFNMYTAAATGQKRVMADYLNRSKIAGVPPDLVVGRELDATLEQPPLPTPGSTLNGLLKPPGTR